MRPEAAEIERRSHAGVAPRLRGLVRTVASLRLTVVLMTLAMGLVFLGTLAQARIGVWEAVDTFFRAPIVWVDPATVVPTLGGGLGWRVPLPGGVTVGAALFVNLVAALVVRFGAMRARPGLLVVHLGLIVLLAGEFATGLLADEGLMRIDEGGRSRHVEDVRRVEIAVVDFSDPDRDRVVSVPGSNVTRAARNNGAIRNGRLPFDISIESWLPNARLFHRHEGGEATTGIGTGVIAEPAPRGTGSDTDMPAAYVTLRRGDESLGTWLLWAGLDELQAVKVGDTSYGIALRFSRSYLPFELHLLDFRHDTFVGTQIARNFSSDVRIVDPERGVDRPVRIWMNNPLRYRGLAFYQASYKPDGSGTVLQVVQNPGWLLPYLACAMVGLGLTWHLGVSLLSSLRRRRSRGEGPAVAKPNGGARPGSRASWLGVVGACVGMALASAGLLGSGGGLTDAERVFASLPVLAGGRVKPVDSAARNLLMAAGGRASVRTEEGTVEASGFLLDLIARPESVANLPVVRVDHPGVLSLLNLTPEDGGRISLGAVEPHWNRVVEQAAAAFAMPDRERDGFQRAVLQLHDRVSLMLEHARMREPYVVPPLQAGEQWHPFDEAFLDHVAAQRATRAGGESLPHPGVAYFVAMMTAYSEGDAAGFEQAVRAYDELLRRDLPEARARARLEVLFNRAAPFAGAMAVYVLAGLALLGSFLLDRLGDGWAIRSAVWCRRGAFGLLLAGVAVHTLAIAARMWLQERPPVTNLYSSAVFVGWACVLVGLVIERLVPLGLASLGSATIGFCTLVVAHNLGNDGDTMQMMQAVLDSNFWLATHVVAITLGYSATFLAGVLGALHILLGVVGRGGTERARSLARVVYGVVLFALLLSFVGTVLGGIWADQSWGRFWGWDPKENGAALVVLLHAVIVHARWGGLVRDRGIAVLAVGGNIVTAWSWFGTNMLGVGLHSYGFMDSAALWLGAFVASQAALMGVGMWLGRGARLGGLRDGHSPNPEG